MAVTDFRCWEIRPSGFLTLGDQTEPKKVDFIIPTGYQEEGKSTNVLKWMKTKWKVERFPKTKTY